MTVTIAAVTLSEYKTVTATVSLPVVVTYLIMT